MSTTKFELRDTFKDSQPESKFPQEAHKVLLLSAVPSSFTDKETGELVETHELTVKFEDGETMTFQKKGLQGIHPSKGVRPGTIANIVFVDAREDEEIKKIFISVKSIIQPVAEEW